MSRRNQPPSDLGHHRPHHRSPCLHERAPTRNRDPTPDSDLSDADSNVGNILVFDLFTAVSPAEEEEHADPARHTPIQPVHRGDARDQPSDASALRSSEEVVNVAPLLSPCEGDEAVSFYCEDDGDAGCAAHCSQREGENRVAAAASFLREDEVSRVSGYPVSSVKEAVSNPSFGLETALMHPGPILHCGPDTLGPYIGPYCSNGYAEIGAFGPIAACPKFGNIFAQEEFHGGLKINDDIKNNFLIGPPIFDEPIFDEELDFFEFDTGPPIFDKEPLDDVEPISWRRIGPRFFTPMGQI